MRRKINIFKLSLIAFIGIVIIWGCISLFMVQKLRREVFYYPDARYSKLKTEQRWIKLSSSKYAPEVVLVQEYILGPIHYHLRKGEKGSFVLNHIFLADLPSGEVMILDFDSGFSTELLSNKEGNTWWFKGLLKTLSADTKIQKLIILENGKKVALSLGNWDFKFSIPIKH